MAELDSISESSYTGLMRRAASHARAHGALPPVLSPVDSSVLDPDPARRVPVAELARNGIAVIPWTTNDPDTMRAVIRSGVAGLISDYPERLQSVLAEERAAARIPGPGFDVQGHRGARGLRPENTLPAFECGLDHGVTTLETDTGVTRDGISLLSHDQYLNPQSCRRLNGQPYTLADRVYLHDISLHEAQQTFVCDRIHTGTPFAETQRNDPALSPVAVAFAQAEGLPNPYVPTHVEQLFRFTRFYADYFRSGPGVLHPRAARRVHTGETVRFNLETKLIPDGLPPAILARLSPGVPHELASNHTAGPQAFVDALCGAIARHGMESRASVQSFDFRTLQLVEEQFPAIQTVYLTEGSDLFPTEFLPGPLRF